MLSLKLNKFDKICHVSHKCMKKKITKNKNQTNKLTSTKNKNVKQKINNVGCLNIFYNTTSKEINQFCENLEINLLSTCFSKSSFLCVHI